ncbi:cytochrome c1 [Kordiimonas marina]|uniref:cytochrome c1 n=1 Tax=Kordiimonas marina TaxID=2872312 RepID=UPI001FF369E5|nr:cytochrome c1 [Kordiimonas marina]MCJ9427517.1 cytochrome c1 [Kordiimonas marina]
MKFVKTIAIALTAVVGMSGTALAAEGPEHPMQMEWSFEGPFGQFDLPSVQRGWQVFREVCANCHSLKYFHFRNLSAIGYEPDMIKAFAAEYTVPGGVDDSGDPVTRPGRPADAIPAPFANEQAARAANGGALPPDLSLIVKAREDGPNYVYSILNGYGETPAGVSIPDGKHFNKYFKGDAISMPQPLSDGMVDYQDGTPNTQEQLSKDVVNFLSFVADPHLPARHRIGLGVVGFLVIWAFVLYRSMKKLWKPVKEGKNFYEDA